MRKTHDFIVFICNATLNRTPDYFKQKSYANSWIFKMRTRKLWYRKTAFNLKGVYSRKIIDIDRY